MKPTTERRRGRRVNQFTGSVVFVFPALVSVIALTTTMVRLGPGPALTAAPVCLLGIVPSLLWHRYIRRQPPTAAARIGWTALGLLATAAILVSPLFWWSAPTLLVIMSETIRLDRPRAGQRRHAAATDVIT